MFRIDLNNPIIDKDMNEINERFSDSRLLYNSSVYISGAAGMIASYIVCYFIYLNEKYNAGISIYAGIRNANKAESRFGKYIHKEYFHVIGSDVTDGISDDIDLDYIIHAASLASPQFYGVYPVETMLPNILGTYNLLEYSRNHTIKKMLFLSSGAVYGSVFGNETMKEDDQGTLDFLDLGNTYAESKRTGEALCHSYSSEYDVPAVIARVHHTYGPTVDIETDSRVHSEFISNVINGNDIVLKSTGEAMRAFCYITDTVTGLLRIMISGHPCEAYNLGNPYEYISIRDLAETLIGLFKEKNIKVIYEIRNDAGYRSCAAPLNAPISIDKIKELGWEPVVSISEGFTRTVHSIECSGR